jgi:hypothetical protein
MRYRALDGQKHFGKGGEMWCGYAAFIGAKISPGRMPAKTASLKKPLPQSSTVNARLTS